jgi:hypothetical protein
MSIFFCLTPRPVEFNAIKHSFRVRVSYWLTVAVIERCPIVDHGKLHMRHDLSRTIH